MILMNIYEYVSIEQNLRTLLMNDSYVRALLEDKCKPGILCDFVDGQKVKITISLVIIPS